MPSRTDAASARCVWSTTSPVRPLAIAVDTSLSGVHVGRALDRTIAGHGKPAIIVSDNGAELTSHAILRWQNERSIEWHYIAPVKPSPPARLALAAHGLRSPGLELKT
jgi:transposase InsO family protein